MVCAEKGKYLSCMASLVNLEAYRFCRRETKDGVGDVSINQILRFMVPVVLDMAAGLIVHQLCGDTSG